MIYVQFLIGLVLYLVMATSSYHETFKLNQWYFPFGIACAIVSNLLWFSIAKSEPNSSTLMVKGLFWDVMLMMCYLVVPLLFFNAKFTTTQAVGVGLTLIGLVLTKI